MSFTSVAGTAVYVKPSYVVSLRRDPSAPERVNMVKLRHGESMRVVGDHEQVADKLARAA